MRRAAYVALVVVTGGCGEDDLCALEVPGTVCRIAGTGSRGFDGDGRAATATSFYLPSQARRGPDGLVYVMDFNNMRLRRIASNGEVDTVAGTGEHAGAIEGLSARVSSLESPIDFDFLPDRRIVLVSSHDPRVLMIDFDGTLRRIAGTSFLGQIGNEGDGGPAVDARFVELAGISVAPDGAIYVSDRGANRVRVIRDGIISTVAGTGVPGGSGDGGPARSASLDEPTALVADADGNVFIADSANCAVRRVDARGQIDTIAGSHDSGFGGDGGPARGAMLARPEGIALALDGALVIADRFNNRLRKVSPDGTITTIAGRGDKGLDGDGGPAEEAAFGNLGRIQIDTDGGLIVVDQTNSIVRKILPATE